LKMEEKPRKKMREKETFWLDEGGTSRLWSKRGLHLVHGVKWGEVSRQELINHFWSVSFGKRKVMSRNAKGKYTPHLARKRSLSMILSGNTEIYSGLEGAKHQSQKWKVTIQ